MNAGISNVGYKGLSNVHKRRPQLGSVTSADILWTRGEGRILHILQKAQFFRCGCPHILAQKLWILLMGCPYGQRRV